MNRQGLLCITAVLVAFLLLPGCSPTSYAFGDHVEARYANRTLTARLPDTQRVPAVMAALDEVLRDRGYTVVESSTTEDFGKVVARAPRYRVYPRVVIEARQTADACVVSMRNDPFGDQDQVEQMMRALIERLGI